MSDRTYWKCTAYNRTKCKARVTTQGNTARLNTEHHNHQPPAISYEGLQSQVVSIILSNSRSSVRREEEL
ncbi:unnamed protein product [Acanthoscelides obtectus]|uniref:FLYWCH-type domain-containing protein n=1 Tax=Acanthoscelides obtectus TaxID=200917 RepID=A0A9P0MA73_ACAOB|nr:unnamed protein product [Acanthoscelides obtectus]CAH2014707.1 unnamed protein product [Acanthoscelides obtectus]CAK1676608.1 hypothetical protein AOBTE_LOCUS30850 [Acanthoscelides obtectus]CAK1676619.1 hypothetical protein AOBTE_LOCUS30861 [Acanthoscelides obtectus]